MVGWSITLCLLGAATLAVGVWLQRFHRRRPPPPPTVDPVPDVTRIGPYEIVGELGTGGMGLVFEARHVALNRPTAIKLIKPSDDEAARARFHREAELTSSLSHPNTITLYDYGQTSGGVAWLALELADGVTLDRVLREEGPLPARRVLGILHQIAGALAHAHDRHVVHRDVKPSNVMLGRSDDGRDVVKLIDFGLAKRISREDRAAQARTSIVGTPLFMAPESSDPASDVGPEVDVYGVGMIGYALLTGTFLFGDHSPQSLARAHLTEPPLPPSLKTDADVPADLERVILRCLEKDPRGRFADGRALLDALATCEEPVDTMPPRIRAPQPSGVTERELVDTKAFPLVRRKQA